MKVLKERIEEIITLIAEVANGNFDYEIDASETGDELDAIISGISMLGQELKSSTVSRDFMQSIYKGVVDMLLVLNTDFSIRSVNDACEELLGFKETELKGMPLADLFRPQDNPVLPQLLEELKENGKILNAEFLLVTKQKQNIPVSCSFSYLLNNRQVVDGILIIAKDITEIKRTEQELKDAKTKAEAANEAKSSFLSSMSHEIRTPLNGIMGFTNLLMATKLNNAQAQYVHLIKTSGSTLTKLLSDILDLHRIEQDKICLETIPFNIRESVASNLEPYRHLAQGKNLQFTYVFDDQVPEVVLGDPTRIGQVLINLVSNAIKFTAIGSIHVHLSAAQQETETVRLKCTVADTGTGIPAEKQAAVFETFTQSDHSTTRKYGGFGLGLAICKKLVHLMEGEIKVASPLPGLLHGTCFEFSLTLKQVQDKRQITKDSGSGEVFRLEEGTQILVVDDNEINVMLMQTVLEQYGATVTSATSGIEALKLARTGNFDLVFMDVEMPEMDGLEAAVLLRKSHFDRPIIAFSANAYKEDIRKSLEAGMSDHLCKPFDQDDLETILKKWVPSFQLQ